MKFSILIELGLAIVLFLLPFKEAQSVGFDFGIFGYELFFRENEKPNQTTLEVPGWDLHAHIWRKQLADQSYLNRVSGESLFVGFKDFDRKEKIQWDLDIRLTSGPDTGLRNYYLGKNHYFGYKTNQFLLGVGRREHLFSPKSFSTQYDGGEGLFIEFKPDPLFTFQIFVWDFYSGAILLSKDQFRHLLVTNNDQEIFTKQKQGTELGRSHRRRHSFGLVYGDVFSLRLGVHYLELGSLGVHSKDHPQEPKKNFADGDSLFSGNVGVGIQWEYFSLELDFLWCKGSDRTRSQVAAHSGTIPISGEAFQLGSELRFGGLKLRSSHFLSDRAEKNDKHQIVKEGYISLGSHPSQTPYLSQIFRIFPSAAVTESGYEKNFAIIEGRSYGYLTELLLSLQYKQILLKWIGNYFVPYKQNGTSDGRISFQKPDFERFYISELMMEVSLGVPDGLELGFGVSKLFLPESMGIHSNFGYVFGRLQI